MGSRPQVGGAPEEGVEAARWRGKSLVGGVFGVGLNLVLFNLVIGVAVIALALAIYLPLAYFLFKATGMNWAEGEQRWGVVAFQWATLTLQFAAFALWLSFSVLFGVNGAGLKGMGFRVCIGRALVRLPATLVTLLVMFGPLVLVSTLTVYNPDAGALPVLLALGVTVITLGVLGPTLPMILVEGRSVGQGLWRSGRLTGKARFANLGVTVLVLVVLALLLALFGRLSGLLKPPPWGFLLGFYIYGATLVSFLGALFAFPYIKYGGQYFDLAEMADEFA